MTIGERPNKKNIESLNLTQKVNIVENKFSESNIKKLINFDLGLEMSSKQQKYVTLHKYLLHSSNQICIYLL